METHPQCPHRHVPCGDAVCPTDAPQLQQRVHDPDPAELPIDGRRTAPTSSLAGVLRSTTQCPLHVAPGTSTLLFVVTGPRRGWTLVCGPEKLSPLVKLSASKRCRPHRNRDHPASD